MQQPSTSLITKAYEAHRFARSRRLATSRQGDDPHFGAGAAEIQKDQDEESKARREMTPLQTDAEAGLERIRFLQTLRERLKAESEGPSP